ncbi:MAG: metallophosphoesterase, partial [Acidobacteriota bacterium]
MSPAPALWAIGDVHGHLPTLEALVGRLERDFGLDLARDRLWLVGDLVNRGPDSLGVLRWARSTSRALGERFACVLGNHDLHLLAAAAGLREPAGDLRPVLDAPDAAELLDWLRHRPLAVRDG